MAAVVRRPLLLVVLVSCRPSAVGQPGGSPANDARAEGLPPLPRSDAAVDPPFRPPEPSPPAPCAQDQGWDGYRCVSRRCPTGEVFKDGSGCIRRFVEHNPPPGWTERYPWSNEPSEFDRAGASSAVDSVSLVACERLPAPPVLGVAWVVFAPSGEVSRVVLGDSFANTPRGDCIVEQLKRVRVSSFGGGPQTVFRVLE